MDPSSQDAAGRSGPPETRLPAAGPTADSGWVSSQGGLHLAHWGTFAVQTEQGDVTAVHPWAGDGDPPPLRDNLVGSVRHRARVARPAVRRGWWEHGPGPDRARGSEDYVQPPWDEVLDALAGELRRVIGTHGNQAIYAGSYGWASAGVFHHAPSQVHRFLNCLGGYTRSVNSYSSGAAEVILPRVIGADDVFGEQVSSWEVLTEHTELMLCFGGLSARTAAIQWGGSGDHPLRGAVEALVRRGTRIVSVSPIRDDLAGAQDDPDAQVRWVPIAPGTDVAVMLAMAWVLHTQNLADRSFLSRYCVGYEQFAAYLTGEEDGVAKTPQWAQALSGIPARVITELARELPRRRCTIAVTWSLQRAQYGEQAPWLGAVLAAMTGQIGLPGGGFAHGYGSMNKPGLRASPWPVPVLPQGVNGVSAYIPVAAVSELLLHPGTTLRYAGRELDLPDIRLVYWAGGNPFHHHQDLFRLRRAFTRPDTVVVHDPYWTATARHADIVLPSTTPLERDDLAGSRQAGHLLAVRAGVARYAQSRDDYDTFTALARRLDVEQAFTQGRDARAWLRHLYGEWVTQVARCDPAGSARLPTFEGFWAAQRLPLATSEPVTAFARFRQDPEAFPRPTRSGRIEITSATIAALNLPDCPGHPAWLAPDERLGTPRAATYPLALLANQPAARFHSQLDMGPVSHATKIAGREPLRMHPVDAQTRGLRDGQLVRVFNDRGALLAGLRIDDAVRADVVQLSTGAWFDPVSEQDGPGGGPGLCAHGNPNVLTADVRTSTMAQGCAGAHALVQVEAYVGEPPPLRCYDPPVAQ